MFGCMGFSSRGLDTFKKLAKVPILLEELDFQSGAMVEVKGQPMEGRDFSVKYKRVGIRKEKGWSCVPGGKGDQLARSEGSRGEAVGFQLTGG